MLRRAFISLAILALIQFRLGIALAPPSLAQEWAARKLRRTLRVVDWGYPSVSVILNYAKGLLTLDEDNNWIPHLAEDWRWIHDRTIEFELKEGVSFIE